MRLQAIQSIPGRYVFWCPGCEALHQFDKGWTFDGNMESPTISPSLLTRWHAEGDAAGTVEQVCHLFLKGGVLQFLGDCTHLLAGKSVPLPELPAWMRGDPPQTDGGG